MRRAARSGLSGPLGLRTLYLAFRSWAFHPVPDPEDLQQGQMGGLGQALGISRLFLSTCPALNTVALLRPSSSVWDGGGGFGWCLPHIRGCCLLHPDRPWPHRAWFPGGGRKRQEDAACLSPRCSEAGTGEQRRRHWCKAVPSRDHAGTWHLPSSPRELGVHRGPPRWGAPRDKGWLGTGTSVATSVGPRVSRVLSGSMPPAPARAPASPLWLPTGHSSTQSRRCFCRCAFLSALSATLAASRNTSSTFSRNLAEHSR